MAAIRTAGNTPVATAHRKWDVDDARYTGALLDLLVDESDPVIPEAVLPSQWMPSGVPLECQGSVRLCVALLGDAIESAAVRPKERERVRAWILEPWSPCYPVPFGQVCEVLDLDVWLMAGGIMRRLTAFDKGERHRPQRHRCVAREKVMEVVAA